MSEKFVYDFADGNKDQKDLLGGKGANLAEMTNLGLPVPPGFTITTAACRRYLADGERPPGLGEQIAAHLTTLESALGRRLGDAADPLLVSVRSGAVASMPGMMETVLNVGLNDDSVAGLSAQAGGNDRFAWDSYRRLIQMFGKTVCDVPGEDFEEAIHDAKQAKGVTDDLHLDAGDLRELVATFKKVFAKHTGHDFPQDPREQLDLAIEAVFRSWNADRAVLYRRQERIAADLGTAVNVVAMVFGNLGADSGTGVAFTRDPATGERGVYGDYLADAQGEDVVAGIRNTVGLADLEQLDKKSFDELIAIMATLEEHYRDLCDIEFTIERGKLWMLQTRVGKRTAAAAFTIAAELVAEGVIDLDEALRRVTGAQLAQLMFPRFDLAGDPAPLTRGVGASPGAAVGQVVFTAERAVERAAAGTPVILVRRETNPDDLAGMIAAQGILTSRGGKTSHAAVVARGMGKTCVCGADQLEVRRDFCTVGGHRLSEGDVISIDGTTGRVYLGPVPVQPSEVVQYFEARTDRPASALDFRTDRPASALDSRTERPASALDRPLAALDRRASGRDCPPAALDRPASGFDQTAAAFGSPGAVPDRVASGSFSAQTPLVAAVHQIMAHADAHRRLLVRTNADTAADAARARRFGAQGIGLCRTEHMFLGDRRELVERLILATAREDRDDALAALLPLQRADFVEIMREMDGLPVTVRLIDPPLHEFLPSLEDLAVKVAVARERGEDAGRQETILAAVRRMHEQNPMLGLRGVRLGLVIPGLFAMQVRAIAEAAAQLAGEGLNPRPEIMVPLVGAVQELETVRAEAEKIIAEVAGEAGVEVLIGTMIEVPRAALTAGQIAEAAEFFSFGTNDLTQMAWGFSRDDVEGAFFWKYLELGIFGISPFESIDRDGVGRLVRIAAQEGRAARPGLKLGVCGEHGGDPESVHFFHEAGLDYVSCSPFRVPVARLEAGRAALG